MTHDDYTEAHEAADLFDLEGCTGPAEALREALEGAQQ